MLINSIKLIISYLISYFCHIQLCNDDCWVICILFANVKSLFDHVTRRYDIASVGAESERQDLQADRAQPERTTPFKHKSGDARFALSMDRIASPFSLSCPMLLS